MSIWIDIPIQKIDVVVDDEEASNLEYQRRIGMLMDEVIIDLISSPNLEIKSRLIYAFKELANVYLISNGSWDLVGVYSETHDLPSLSIQIQKILTLIETTYKNDIVFLSMTRKTRQLLLLHEQRKV